MLLPGTTSAKPTETPSTNTSTAAPGTLPAPAAAAVSGGMPEAMNSVRSASIVIIARSSEVTLSLSEAPVSLPASRTTALGNGAAKFSISRSYVFGSELALYTCRKYCSCETTGITTCSSSVVENEPAIKLPPASRTSISTLPAPEAKSSTKNALMISLPVSPAVTWK